MTRWLIYFYTRHGDVSVEFVTASDSTSAVTQCRKQRADFAHLLTAKDLGKGYQPFLSLFGVPLTQ